MAFGKGEALGSDLSVPSPTGHTARSSPWPPGCPAVSCLSSQARTLGGVRVLFGSQGFSLASLSKFMLRDPRPDGSALAES